MNDLVTAGRLPSLPFKQYEYEEDCQFRHLNLKKSLTFFAFCFDSKNVFLTQISKTGFFCRVFAQKIIGYFLKGKF